MRRLGLTPRVLAAGGALLAVVAIAFLSMLVAIGNLRDAGDESSATEHRIALATQIERRVIDLQAGTRGYLITGDREFLEPYEDARRTLPGLRSQLLSSGRRAEGGAPIGLLTRTFRRINSYVFDYLEPLQTTAARDLDAARAIVATGRGKRRVERLRGLFASYVARETVEAERQRREADDSASNAILFGVFGLIGLAALIVLATLLMSRTVAAPVRRISNAAGRLRGGDLAVRVEERGAGEVRALASSFNAMAASMQQSRDELESQHAELEAQQSELERAVEQLEQERDRIQTFHDFVTRLTAEHELDRLGAALLDELSKLAAADAATLYAIDPSGTGSDSESLLLVASRGFDPEYLANVVNPGQGLAGVAVAEEQIVRASHGESGFELPAFGRDVRVRHELHIPIGRPGGMIGVVSLAKVGEPGFAQAQEERLAQRTGPVAVALANALSLEAAERAAQLNEAVLESAQDAFVAADEESNVLVWTRQAEEMFGYLPEEMIGQRFFDTCFPDIPRENFEELRHGFLAAAERGQLTQRIEVRARRKDGSPFRVEISASAVRVGEGWRINLFMRDVTGRTRRNEERRAEEAVSRVLAETDRHEDLITPIMGALGENLGWLYGGFWEYDERTALLRMSRPWSAPDFSVPELDQAVEEEYAFRPNDPDPRFSIFRRAWASREVRWEPVPEEGRSADLARTAGIRSALALPVQSGDKVLGLLAFGTKWSAEPSEERMQALRSIADLIGQVMERRNAEHEAERMKNEFFALVSHELRTPLTSIIGYLDIVREEEAGEVNEDQRHYLEVIDRNARRLQRLVGDLLFVAQVEAGTLTLKSGEVDLEKVARDAVEAARPRAGKQGVELDAETEPVMIGGDSDRIGQLVDNLVSNAIKFTPKGGSVTVRLRANGDSASLEVIDTGMGISEEDQEHLFARFYRTADASKLAIPGIGLGLSISRAIAEGHGGTIQVQSQEGAGTTFRVELPRDGSRRPEGNGALVGAGKGAGNGR